MAKKRPNATEIMQAWKLRLDKLDEVTGRLSKRLDALEEKSRQMELTINDIFREVLQGNRTVASSVNINMEATNDLAVETRKVRDELKEVRSMVRDLSFLPPVAYSGNEVRISRDDTTAKITSIIAERFTDDEITELLIASGMPSDIKGNTRMIRVANAIRHAKNTSRFSTFILNAAQERPNVKWPFGTDWLKSNED